ncbi:MAG TPA: phosphate ABC transporter substrate-binding protein [Bacillota bacterium]
MRKAAQYYLSLVALLVIVGAWSAGCCGTRRGRISVVGSTSVQPIAEVLAEGFSKIYPDQVVNVQGGGSSAGIKAVRDGTAAIGTSSRPLKPEEQPGLSAVEIARDGIAIVTHPDNPIENLTLEQLRKIFSNEITDWSRVNGKAGTILVVNREAGSGTREAFTKIVMAKAPLGLQTIVQGSTGTVRQTVSGSRNAVGYLSLTALDATVKTVRINGVAPTFENIKQKKYPIVRSFLFVYKTPDRGVSKFIDYVLNQGQGLVQKNRLVPVK